MPEQVSFVRHESVLGSVCAIFSDPQGGPDFVVNREECQRRLINLRRNNFPSEETEKALKYWPEQAD